MNDAPAYQSQCNPPNPITDSLAATQEPSISFSMPGGATRTSLNDIGVPAHYPIAASFFSKRVKEAAFAAELNTVQQLYENANALGEKNLPNFGAQSRDEVRDFVTSIVEGNRAGIRRYVPILTTGGTVDFGLVVRLTIEQRPSPGLEGMHAHLVQRKTLADVGRAAGRKRQRIQQVEALLFDAIGRSLDAMPEIKTQLWRGWSTRGTIASVPSDEDGMSQEIAVAAIEEVFRKSPGGREVLLRNDEDCGKLVESLRDFPEYYSGELELAQHVQQQGWRLDVRYILSWNERHQQFSADEQTGRISARRFWPKWVVAALVRHGVRDAGAILKFLERVDAKQTHATLGRNVRIWRREDPHFPNIDFEGTNAEIPSRPTPHSKDLNEPSDRIEVTTYRILRDTALARRAKHDCNFRCQICGQTIRLPDGQLYAEAHHIVPLGRPHNGSDKRENIICVCPNHHAELDYGAIRLDRASLMTGADFLSQQAIDYHNRQIYGSPPNSDTKRADSSL